MEKNTEEQILEELKEINESLQDLKANGSMKPPSAIGSFLIGFIVVAFIILILSFIFAI